MTVEYVKAILVLAAILIALLLYISYVVRRDVEFWRQQQKQAEIERARIKVLKRWKPRPHPTEPLEEKDFLR